MRVSSCSVPWIILPTLLIAQQPSKDSVTLNPVVVTATRIPTPAADVPVAVTVLRGTDLRAQGIGTVLDALREVPGAAVVQTGSFGGQTSLFLRGGQSNYVKVLVDGVPVNQPGGSFDFANLTTDNIDRIEVVRGPTSVLYGSDAVTGVVQIFTRPGTGASTGRSEASVRGGTYGTLVWDAAASGGSEAASYSVSLSRFASEGTYAFNNRYQNTLLSGLARVALDDRTEAKLTLRYGDDLFHFPTNGAGVPVDHNQFTAGSGPTLGLDLGHYFAPRLEARLLLATNETNGAFDNRPDSAADSSRFQSLDDVRRSSADLRVNWDLPGYGVLTLGTALEQEHERSFNVCQTSFGDCSTPPIDSSRWNTAFYVQAVRRIRGVVLTTGARVEDNQRFGTFVAYRVGAAYRLAEGTRFRATVGTGFREPTFIENYSSGFSVGNPNLKPEHSRSWEVGVEQPVAGRATLSATFFDQRFVDMIDYNPGAPTGAPNYGNVAAAHANGVELGVSLVPAGPLSLAVSYTYLHTDVTNPGFDSSSGALLAAGQPLTRRPKHSGRFDAGYHVRDRGTVSLAVTYVGDRVDQDFSTFPFPRVPLPAYARVDVATELDALRVKGGAPGVALSLRIENLLDHQYEEVKNFPARRRTLLFGGEVRFGT
ncbi:MAG TPA: TonB-dependent receptor [Gemmatimonadales bacterium]|nr:TonB-dependent receptor [Gemmatimonadales bacterium]